MANLIWREPYDTLLDAYMGDDMVLRNQFDALVKVCRILILLIRE